MERVKIWDILNIVASLFVLGGIAAGIIIIIALKPETIDTSSISDQFSSLDLPDSVTTKNPYRWILGIGIPLFTVASGMIMFALAHITHALDKSKEESTL